MERLQNHAGHGMLVILASMFAGFMLMFGLLGGLEVWPGVIVEFSVYGRLEGWVRAHPAVLQERPAGHGHRFCPAQAEPERSPAEIRRLGLYLCAWSFTIFTGSATLPGIVH